MLMDFQCLDVLLGLPAFRVIQQVLGPQQLEVHLERRDDHLVCPHCGTAVPTGRKADRGASATCPSWSIPSCGGCTCGVVRAASAGIAPGKRVQPSESGRSGRSASTSQGRAACVRGCPGDALARRSGLSARTVLRWTFARSRGGRPRKRGRAIGIDAYARRTGHPDNTLIVDWEQGPPMATLKGRRADEVIAWGKSRSPDESNKVEVVVLDMSKTYFAAVKEVFGDHGQVIDRFPVVQQAGGALDEVRRAVPKQLAPADAKALKKLRKRWLKSAAQRTGTR